MNLSCQAVNGNPQDTAEVAIAMSLMNLSFRILDDIIDKTYSRKFLTTFVGKFGESTALIVGGVISAKAFTLLNQASLDVEKKRKINALVWNYCAKMAEVETNDLEAKIKEYSAKNKLNKIKAETINVQTSLEIGVIIGNGSTEETEGLKQYGECLGILLELQNDLQVSLNLTLELARKIKTNSLPLWLLRAKESSKEIDDEVKSMIKKEVTPEQIGRLVNLLLKSQAVAKTKEEIKLLTANGIKSLARLESNKEVEKMRIIIEAQEQLIACPIKSFIN